MIHSEGINIIKISVILNIIFNYNFKLNTISYNAVRLVKAKNMYESPERT
jgi:hypothetical protein